MCVYSDNLWKNFDIGTIVVTCISINYKHLENHKIFYHVKNSNIHLMYNFFLRASYFTKVFVHTSVADILYLISIPCLLLNYKSKINKVSFKVIPQE
jgi:hypothetical protein